MSFQMKSSSMKRSNVQAYVFRWCMAALLLVVIIGSVSTQIPPPPDPPKLVNDFADLLTNSEEEDLERRLLAHEDSTSNQIVIITMPDLGGYEIAQFSYTLGDRWGVGTAEKDNGAVVTIAQEERRAFIATGRGLEGALPDAICNRIVDNIMVPHFKNGNFYRGLLEGTDAMMRTIGGEYVKEAQESSDEGLPVWAVFGIVFLILFISWAFRNSDRGGQIFGGGWGGPIIFGRGGGSWGGGSSGGFGGGGFGGFGGGSFGGGGAGGSW